MHECGEILLHPPTSTDDYDSVATQPHDPSVYVLLMSHATLLRLDVVVLSITCFIVGLTPSATVAAIILAGLPVAAADQSPFLSVLSLNCNRMSATVPHKIFSLTDMIITQLPAVFVLTEFAVLDGIPRLLRTNLGGIYNMYHTPPDPRNTGIIVGVMQKITSSQAAQQPQQRFSRSILPVTLILPEVAGSGDLSELTLLAVYAPQSKKYDKRKANSKKGKPQEEEGQRQAKEEAEKGRLMTDSYWEEVARLLPTNKRWVATGDMNMALAIHEVTPHHNLLDFVHHADNNHYRGFLQSQAATDLWQIKDDVDLLEDFTYKGKWDQNDGVSLSIIDRTAIGPHIPGGNITTLDTLVEGSTDHRPILSQFSVSTEGADGWKNTNRQRRLIQPKEQSDAFEPFQKRLSAFVEANEDLLAPLLSNDDFNAKLSRISQEFDLACAEAFERPEVKKPRTSPAPYVPPELRKAKGELELAKNALRMTKTSRTKFDTWTKTLNRRDKFTLGIPNNETFSQSGERIELLRAKKAEEYMTVRTAYMSDQLLKEWEDTTQIALNTGSTKKILPNQRTSIPPIVRLSDGSFTAEPKEMVERWRSHFETAYIRPEPPSHSKPWLECDKSHSFRSKTAEDPFQWPRLMLEGDLHDLLSKGKPDPAPGPDGWEKWALKNAGPKWHGAVSNLVNYMINNNYFPDTLSGNYLIPIHKRGDFTDPANYRGIVLAGMLQKIAGSWLTETLQDYCDKMGLIPDTQTAGHRGKQPSDAMHILHAIDGYFRIGRTSRKWCLGLKRDQKTAFDALHMNGFEDAAEFFGLPKSLVPFEKARAANVSFILRCRGTDSEPIRTTGLTKQGDPFSVLKYALTLSMMQWWIDETLPNVGALITTRRRPHLRHTGLDKSERRLRLLAATDDTIAFAESKEDLITLVSKLEDFQTAYNMQTEWHKANKTTLMTFGMTPKLKKRATEAESAEHREKFTITFPLQGQDPVTLRAVADTERRFLNTPINSPETQYSIIKDVVSNFVLPNPGRTLPITAVNTLIQVSLMSKIKARLDLHPIRPKDATDLKKKIAGVVQRYQQIAYPISTDVLFGDVMAGGLGFVNPEKLNATASVAPLHRLLNEGEYPSLMQIIHAELQCTNRNGMECWLPLGGPRPPPPTAPPPPAQATLWRSRRIFKTWEIAREYLDLMKAAIVPVTEEVESTKEGHRHMETVRSVVDAVKSEFYTGDDGTELQISPASAEPETAQDPHLTWATDGSMQQAERGEQRNVGFAFVGPINGSARLRDRFASIQDAEVIAIAMALFHDNDFRNYFALEEARTTVYSDHLNTVNFVNDILRGKPQNVYSGTAARHALRFLKEMVEYHTGLFPGRLEVKHVKAHTEDTTIQAQLNRKADELAKAAATSGAPFSIFWTYCDQYALLTKQEGCTHAAVKPTLEWLWDQTHRPLIFRLPTNPIDPKVRTPDRNISRYHDAGLFTKSIHAYTALIQLQLRSHQLPTPKRNFGRPLQSRAEDEMEKCHFCTCRIEEVDERHLFVECRGESISKIKEEMLTELRNIVKDKFGNEDIPAHTRFVEGLFQDGALWADNITMYWQGLLPLNFTYLDDGKWAYCSMAGICCKTAARIWSAFRREQQETLKSLEHMSKTKRQERLLNLRQQRSTPDSQLANENAQEDPTSDESASDRESS